jgi:phospholipid N-methyltransferase
MAVPQQSFLTRCVEAVKFFGQYIRHPGTIGAVLPSSNSLAKQIVSEIAKDPSLPPRLILEIGAGTGVFTDKIFKRMNPGDTLHLVEFDKGLARGLKERYQQNPNVKVFCCSILDYEVSENKRYDHVVSGLPLNSFPAPMVARIFQKYKELPREGGTLSYFDYRFLPSIKRIALGKRAREEFDRILVQKANFYANYGVRKKTVVVNVPPARVLHHKITTAAS